MSWADPGLYAIIDPEHCSGRDPIWVAEAILEGGCSILQLRDKRGADDLTLSLAEELRQRCHLHDVRFVLNDRADLALLSGADGLHLGQYDLSVADARKMIGARPVGVSTHNLEEALAAVEAGADLLGFGPVFPTATKENPDPVVGLEGLRTVVEQVELPIVAIGGINPSNAASSRAAGARWAASISAICAADDPAAAAARLHRELRR